jgi:thiol-disulfide isomerase/thioredoxin
MKNTLNLLLILLAGVWLMPSCDEIEAPYLRDSVIIDTSACPVPDFPDLVNPEQKVLLEEYTGQYCPNCPAAAVLAKDLMTLHGDRLVVMAVHAGFFADPKSPPYDNDFRCAEGTELDQFFGIGMAGNPNGMVNRKGFSQSHILAPASWASEIELSLNATPQLALQLLLDWNEEEQRLCSHIRTVFLDDMKEDLKLVLYITEDSIPSAQKNNSPQVGPTPDILDYTQMYMLRGSILGTWGVDLASSDTLSFEGDEVIRSYAYAFPGAWKVEQCRVIAFVYHPDDYRILQVESKKIVE